MFIFPILRKGSLALLSQSRFVLEIVNQASFYACVLREISVPTELALGHLRCRVTDMPPQPNSPSGRCLETRLRNCTRQPRWFSLQHGWAPTSHAPREERDKKERCTACNAREDAHAEVNIYTTPSRGDGVAAIKLLPNLDGAIARRLR